MKKYDRGGTAMASTKRKSKLDEQVSKLVDAMNLVDEAYKWFHEASWDHNAAEDCMAIQRHIGQLITDIHDMLPNGWKAPSKQEKGNQMSEDSATRTSRRPWSVFVHDEQEGGDREVSIREDGEWIATMNLRRSSARDDAALICDAVNLKTRIDEAMADESGYLHPTVLDGKPMVFVSPPPSEAEETKMHRDYETSLLMDRERFRRGYYEALAHNDRLRDLVRRLANMSETTIRDAMENWSGSTSYKVEFEQAAYALIHEAREAIGEDGK